MARGEHEKHCIDMVKELLLQPGIACLGKHEDMAFVKESLEKATPNPASSDFPDFLFEGGFIEHFQVTSTSENRKGSEFRKEQNVFDKKCKESVDANRYRPLPPAGTLTIDSCLIKMESPDSSYENYRKSFKKNWDHHIDSRKGYASKGKSIFLIEMVGNSITIQENGTFKCFYKLAYDKDILEYIYEFRKEVEYVVFTYSDQCEVVSISEIPNYKKSFDGNISFGIGKHTEANLQLFF